MAAELRTPLGRKGQPVKEHGQDGEQAGAFVWGASQPPLAQGSEPGEVNRSIRAGTGRKLARMAFWALQIALAVGLGYWIATTRSMREARIDLPAAEGGSALNAEVVTVTTAPVAHRQIERSIDAVGTLHGWDELTLKTKISGRVAKIYHDFADHVAPGALLVEIDPTDSQLAVEQARRSLNSELAKWGFQEVPAQNADLTQLPTVVAAKVRLDLTRSQLSRLSALQNRGSVTADEIEQTKTNALVAESDYANQLLLARAGAANAQLKKSELDIAEQQLRETKIHVPVREEASGLPSTQYTITDRYVTEGAWLAAGSDLFRLVIDDTLKLRLAISEKHASAVRVGQRVEVATLTAAEPVIGSVARIGPSVDPQTRTFQIEVEVPNQNTQLKTGGFAKARVIVNDQSSADTVPTAALVTFAGVHKVFGVQGDRVVEYRVRLGEQTPEWVELVDSPLPEDAQVVVSGQTRLADGSLVRLRNSDDSAGTNRADTSGNSGAVNGQRSNRPVGAADNRTAHAEVATPVADRPTDVTAEDEKGSSSGVGE